ncbi:MAG: hypothetical protein RIQ84_978 [Pseudomonadota bacterium]|jgi:predicted transcriptional regulator
MKKGIDMALTDFGLAVRKARLDVQSTLADMANQLEVTPAFLSAIETGRKKVPLDFVAKVEGFFAGRGLAQNLNLRVLADISNQSISLEGLSAQQQMLLAGFARKSLDAKTLDKIAELLGAPHAKKDVNAE